MPDDTMIAIDALLMHRRRPDPVRVVQNERGSYDVMLRLDGSYTSSSDADHMLEFWKETYRQVEAAMGYDHPQSWT